MLKVCFAVEEGAVDDDPVGEGNAVAKLEDWLSDTDPVLMDEVASLLEADDVVEVLGESVVRAGNAVFVVSCRLWTSDPEAPWALMDSSNPSAIQTENRVRRILTIRGDEAVVLPRCALVAAYIAQRIPEALAVT